MVAEPRPSGPAATAVVPLTLAGYGLMAFSLARRNGHYEIVALLMILIATLAWALAVWASRGQLRTQTLQWGRIIAWTIALGSAMLGFFEIPGRDIASGTKAYPLFTLYGFAVLLVGSYLPQLAGSSPPPRWFRIVRLTGVLGVGLSLGAWMLYASPWPDIDVWEVHQQGSALLLSGDPVYGGSIRVLDTNRFTRVLHTYGYPPFSLVVTTIGYALSGDTRWAQLLAIVIGAFLLRRYAQRHVRSGDPWPDLLALCLLLHPRGLLTLEYAWGEPLAVPFLVGFVMLLDSGKRVWAAVMLGLLCAVKQHLLLYLPFVLLIPGVGIRGGIIALGVTGATVLPFALWTPAGLWKDVVLHHMANLFRPDSLSVTAHLAREGIVKPQTWWGFAFAAVVLRDAVDIPPKVANLLLASTLAYTLFFLFGRQAFCNYYYLVGVTALVVAAAAVSPGTPVPIAARR